MEVMRADLQLHLPSGTLAVKWQSGERVAIIGPSGCGKSTIARTLAGATTHVTGQFYFRERDLLQEKPWLRSVGHVPQDLQLMPHLDVQQNLLLPRQSKLDDNLNQALGIDHLLKRMPRFLSGGEKQRVALARALSSMPQLLILDEPFASLDEETKNRAIDYVNQYAHERAIPLILISHDMNEVKRLKCEEFRFPYSSSI